MRATNKMAKRKIDNIIAQIDTQVGRMAAIKTGRHQRPGSENIRDSYLVYLNRVKML